MKLTRKERKKRFEKLKDLEKIRFSLGQAKVEIRTSQMLTILFSLLILYFVSILLENFIAVITFLLLVGILTFVFYIATKKDLDLLDKFLIENSK